jgi:hypothetical protein
MKQICEILWCLLFRVNRDILSGHILWKLWLLIDTTSSICLNVWLLHSYFSLTWAESSSELFWSLVVHRPSVRLFVWNLYIFYFFYRTTGPILTNTNHPWVEGILNFSNEGGCLSPREDDRKSKNTLTFFRKSFSPEPVGQLQSNMA